MCYSITVFARRASTHTGIVIIFMCRKSSFHPSLATVCTIRPLRGALAPAPAIIFIHAPPADRVAHEPRQKKKFRAYMCIQCVRARVCRIRQVGRVIPSFSSSRLFHSLPSPLSHLHRHSIP